MIDRTHFRGLDLPIEFRVLEDAQGVDPDVADAERARNGYCMLKSLREFAPRYFFSPLLQSFGRGTNKGTPAPAVTQCDVSSTLKIHVAEKTYVRLLSEY